MWPVRVEVANWRCVERVELELARLNVFIGRNSTGKSSLAYSIYFASRSARDLEPSWMLLQLYGCSFDQVARLTEGGPQYPIVVRAGDQELVVEGEGRVASRFSRSPWADEYLLPSRRVDYLHILAFLPRLLRELKARPEELRVAGSLFGWVLEALKALPILPPFGAFAMDYARALTGLHIGPVEGGLDGVGAYAVALHPLMTLMEFTAHDPYTKLRLPIELGPDGLADLLLLDTVTQRAPKGSLVVIEEPEIHKSPLMVVELTERIVERALNRELTLIMTTHSDIPLAAMSRLVSEGRLRPHDVRVYYFKREPWTQAVPIEVRSDGTIELPDAEELIARLF